jgi:hypothetical protein
MTEIMQLIKRFKKLRICDPAIQTIIWIYWRNQLKTNKVDSGETSSLRSLD